MPHIICNMQQYVECVCVCCFSHFYVLKYVRLCVAIGTPGPLAYKQKQTGTNNKQNPKQKPNTNKNKTEKTGKPKIKSSQDREAKEKR